MSKSVSLSGNQELQFVTDSWEKTVTVYLFDTISDTRVTLTEFVGGKWTSKSISHLDKFFELIIPIATFLTGTLSGIMLAGQKKEDQDAMLAAQKQAADNAAAAAKTSERRSDASAHRFRTGKQHGGIVRGFALRIEPPGMVAELACLAHPTAHAVGRDRGRDVDHHAAI